VTSTWPSAVAYVDELVDKLRQADTVVRERLAKLAAQRSADNEAITNMTHFDIGDKVWVTSPAVPKGTSRKLASRWAGPFQVIDVDANQLDYTVHPLDKLGRLINIARSRVVHINRLKSYVDPRTSSIRQSASSATN
jgi:hypothetical protein